LPDLTDQITNAFLDCQGPAQIAAGSGVGAELSFGDA